MYTTLCTSLCTFLRHLLRFYRDQPAAVRYVLRILVVWTFATYVDRLCFPAVSVPHWTDHFRLMAPARTWHDTAFQSYWTAYGAVTYAGAWTYAAAVGVPTTALTWFWSSQNKLCAVAAGFRAQTLSQTAAIATVAAVTGWVVDDKLLPMLIGIDAE